MEFILQKNHLLKKFVVIRAPVVECVTATLKLITTFGDLRIPPIILTFCRAHLGIVVARRPLYVRVTIPVLLEEGERYAGPAKQNID